MHNGLTRATIGSRATAAPPSECQHHVANALLSYVTSFSIHCGYTVECKLKRLNHVQSVKYERLSVEIIQLIKCETIV